jgi:hypothetical protein
MTGLPKPDAPAYDGNIIVKSTTYNKANRNNDKLAQVDRIRRAIVVLNGEIDNRLTLNSIVENHPTRSLDMQIAVNKDVATELRKVVNMLKTFVQNNSQSIDN